VHQTREEERRPRWKITNTQLFGLLPSVLREEKKEVEEEGNQLSRSRREEFQVTHLASSQRLFVFSFQFQFITARRFLPPSVRPSIPQPTTTTRF
jgi:hypothetical protein